MRAKLCAMTAFMPAPRMAMGACSREEPQPEVALGHEDVAHLHTLTQPCSRPSSRSFAELLGIGRHKETIWAGMMASVSICSPTLCDTPVKGICFSVVLARKIHGVRTLRRDAAEPRAGRTARYACTPGRLERQPDRTALTFRGW